MLNETDGDIKPILESRPTSTSLGPNSRKKSKVHMFVNIGLGVLVIVMFIVLGTAISGKISELNSVNSDVY